MTTLPINNIEVAKNQANKALKLIYQSKFKEAEQLFVACEPFFEQQEDWRSLVQVKLRLGECYRYLGDYDQAIQTLLVGKELALDKLGDMDKELGSIYCVLGSCYALLSEFETGLSYLDQSLHIRTTLFGVNSEPAAGCYEYYGHLYNFWQLYNEALFYYRKALTVRKKLPNKTPFQLIGSHINVALIEGSKGNHEEELALLQKALRILLASSDVNNLYGKGIYGNMAACYLLQGDYHQALAYYQKSLQIANTIWGTAHRQIGMCHNNLAEAYEAVLDYDQQLFHAQKTLTIFREVFNENSTFTAASYQTLGRAYKNLGQYELAIENFEQDAKITRQLIKEDGEGIADYHINVASCYGLMGEPEKQLTHLEKALTIYISIHQTTHPQIAAIYNALADWYDTQQDYDQQLIFAHKAVCSVSTGIFDNNYLSSPDLSTIQLYQEAFTALLHKARAAHQLYLQNKDQEYLEFSLTTYQLLDQVLHQIKQSYKTDASKLFFSKQVAAIYAEGIHIAMLLKRPAIAFYFSEQAKVALLRANLQDITAKELGEIPSELLEQEKALRIELNYLDKRIIQEEQKGKQADQKIIQKLQDQYFEYKNKYDLLIEQFENDYPQYYQLKYDNKIVSIRDLRRQIPEEGILISYYIGTTYYYIFFVTEEEFDCIEMVNPPNKLEQLCTTFYQAINLHQKKEYVELGQRIFHSLVTPIADLIINPYFDEDDKPLIIIPHDYLAYLPFEALLYDKASVNTPYHELPFLLHQCTIQYHYSATLWLHNQQRSFSKKLQDHSFAGFAPIYAPPNDQYETPTSPSLKVSEATIQSWQDRSSSIEGSHWKPLPYSQKEVNQVQQLFDGYGYPTKTFLFDQANKANFIQHTNEVQFLLIAAHGLVHDEQPQLSGLVFYPSNTTDMVVDGAREERSADLSNEAMEKDSIFSMQEAYLLNIRADLVVLSSCESGIGKLEKGEGMMAVNRGFLYAGAKHVVFTLFKVYDEPSAQLIETFFAYVLAGDSYATALRDVKRDFVKQEKLADPKFWSAYILIG